MDTSTLRHKRLPEFESIDDIRFSVRPRFKTSHMSGDVWRQHVEVVFLFKGLEVARAGWADIDAATMGVGGAIIDYRDAGLGDGVIAHEEPLCDQPSCCQKATAALVLKRETSDQGDYLAADPDQPRRYRKFCAAHLERGNASREDSDSNYDHIPYPFSPVA